VWVLVPTKRVRMEQQLMGVEVEARRVERVWLRERGLVLVLGVFVQARGLLLRVLLVVKSLLVLLLEPQEPEADKPGCRFVQAQAVLG
jgi:hypothetical protein